jgi:choline kinase/phosphohistidine swiveling domain-containing protein
MTTELYFLGAGKPASGSKPAALKHIANNTKAMDWQLHSFEDVTKVQNTYFLGGYHVDDVAKAYPELNFTIVPNWENSTAFDTLMQAPFNGSQVFISYSDTLFRKSFVNKLSTIEADVVLVIDSGWKQRYKTRSQADIEKAEIISTDTKDVEFAGLMKLSSQAMDYIKNSSSYRTTQYNGSGLLGLISDLEKSDLSISYLDVDRDWAEFNSPSDITHFILGTKADTLARLEGIVKKSIIGRQESFTTFEWMENSSRVIKRIQDSFADTKLVVRSSSKSEDNWDSSNAGGFESILNVPCLNEQALTDAIQAVVSSYGKLDVGSDQVLVQEFLQDVAMAGVVFTCTLESGAPYYRFNFDDSSKSTESVTAGTHSDLRTVLVSKLEAKFVRKIAPELESVLEAVQELELLLGFDKLDIEFATDTKGQVYIFQVRPVVVNHDNYELDIEKISVSIRNDVRRYYELQPCLPSVSGSETLFANMPDWNPAEIISTRPKPLAFSLYQKLITNDTWAKQRAQYGYRDVRPYPLIVSFSGQPYVDVRASLNSFIPKTVSKRATDRIVNAYLEILSDNPQFHDKIEFDIAFTIWTPDFMEVAKERLCPYGVTLSDLIELDDGLKQITRDSFLRLESDIASVGMLKNRCDEIMQSQIGLSDKIYSLLDDCKRYGTLAFAHAARAGFVANTLLKSLVKIGALSEERKMEFLNSFDTVAGEFEIDKSKYINGFMTEDLLVKKYGHLRPGTYEVTTQAYWEAPGQYLIPKELKERAHVSERMELTSKEIAEIESIIESLGSDITVTAFVDFLVKATQEREKVKFEFTRNLSKALDLTIELGNQLQLSREDVSFLTYSDLEKLKLNTINQEIIRKNIEVRKEEYLLTKAIELPSFINSPENFYCFERHSSQPNFIGVDKVIAEISTIDKMEPKYLIGKVVMIPQADPGYDWLFEHKIVGLITMYGGANSHMAIRAAEIGLPAAIGVGEKLYDTLETALKVELDCLGQLIRVVE